MKRRRHHIGYYVCRGGETWELRITPPRAPGAPRKIHYHYVTGDEEAAKAKLDEFLAACHQGEYVEPSAVTVADHIRRCIPAWETADEIGRKSAERYRELLKRQIEPHLGATRLQDLTAARIKDWHAALRKAGLARATIAQAHRILSKALRDAVVEQLVTSNQAIAVRVPKGRKQRVEAPRAEELARIVAALKGRALEPMIIVAMFTGVRRGELLALRWNRINLESRPATMKIVEALEQTRDELEAKEPKTEAGEREITLPEVVIGALRAHRKQQLEQRAVLGLGRMPADALVFSTINGDYRSPRALSVEWSRFADAIGLGHITLHSLRHMHASQLIAAGVDLVTISKRLGHATPEVTARIYAKQFEQHDTKASEAINKALAGLAVS
jgi:integrase